jgi:Calpain family cysteine protease
MTVGAINYQNSVSLATANNAMQGNLISQRFGGNDLETLARAIIGDAFTDLRAVLAQLSPVEQGQLMRAMDKNIATVSPSASPATAAPAAYNQSNLFGPHGPRLSDIQQTGISNCYFVATLGSLANERPSLIRNAISYDTASQSFNVTLYDAAGAPQTYNVTQAEIADNIGRSGGGRRDDGAANAPVWVDVMEVAYAKQLDTNHADGLQQGYDTMEGQQLDPATGLMEATGGYTEDALAALTGDRGTMLFYDRAAGETKAHALNEMGSAIVNAIKSDRTVTASTTTETSGQDGLVDGHAYTVCRAYKDASGNWQVVMRNPWANNIVGEGKDRQGAFITVPLATLVDTGGLNRLTIGN